MNSEPHPQTGQPVGLAVEAGPAKWPEPVTLKGRFGRVEKLKADHAAGLWPAVQGFDDIWTYMSGYGPFDDAAAFAAWVKERGTLNDPYSYAIIDAKDQPVGIAALMRIDAPMQVIEVGHVLYSPPLQRMPLATEAQYLLARYIFETLGYRRYEWKCHAFNEGSRRAALRLGFSFEGVHRQAMIAKGRNRDTAWYSMLDSEWPARKANFERWLARDNFTPDGRQKESLAAINAGDRRQ